jgi:diaminopimelate epimerase
VLHNADGGRAEMSGNGIRCLAQAMVDAGWIAEGADASILTDAGVRSVAVGSDDGTGLREVRVGMGPAKVTDLEERRAEVDTGNPHVVLLVADPAEEDLEALGAEMPQLNVEIVRVDDRDTVTMRVHERGAGITEACGTGSCAVVAATLAWGLTNARVTVRNPGGDLEVDIEGDEALLTGPAQRVGEVQLAWR